MKPMTERIAGAPISWGVDGSPGWGHLMGPERVLAEMVEIGLGATELGPDGWLPTEPDELLAFLDRFGLDLVGGFVPALLYRPDRIEAEISYVDRAANQLSAGDAGIMVLGPSSDLDGYDTSIEMNDDEWRIFIDNLRRVDELVESKGLKTALHPHWGMAIETQAHVERLLENSDIGICLDTGHLFLAGADVSEITRMALERIHHVHIKDLTATGAESVRSGELAFRQAVIDGLFVPAGTGDVDLEGVIRQLEANGYQGWYVLEQDMSLESDPPPGAGPVQDARSSTRFLLDVAAKL